MTGEFAGLTAVVSGGASAIGEAVAAELTARGARFAAFDLAVDGVPDTVLGVRVDVTDDTSVVGGVERVVAGPRCPNCAGPPRH